MKVKVFSQSGARKFSYKLKKPFVIVSITDSFKVTPNFSRDNPNIIGVCRVAFDDIYQDVSGMIAFNADHAKKIIDFIDRNFDQVDCIVFHCYAGISRSAAVAKVVCDYKGIDSSFIDKAGIYQPNDYVVRVFNDYVGGK